MSLILIQLDPKVASAVWSGSTFDLPTSYSHLDIPKVDIGQIHPFLRWTHFDILMIMDNSKEYYTIKEIQQVKGYDKNHWYKIYGE